MGVDSNRLPEAGPVIETTYMSLGIHPILSPVKVVEYLGMVIVVPTIGITN
jgi:hypothetical protein